MKNLSLWVIIMILSVFNTIGSYGRAKTDGCSQAEFFYGIPAENHIDRIKPAPRTNPFKKSMPENKSVDISPSVFFYGYSIPDPMGKTKCMQKARSEENETAPAHPTGQITQKEFYY